MPDIQNPYNVATEDTAGRLRALGVLTPYDPPPVAAYGLSDQGAPVQTPVPAGSQQVGPAAPSWDAYKSANGYDGTDFVNRQQLWDTYRNNVIPDIAAAHGEDANTLRSFFDQQYAADKPKAPTRSMLQAANDTMISAGNAIFGGIKSVSDLVDPSSGVSHWLGDRIKEGHQQYSPVMQDEEKRREREIADAQARGDSGIAPALSYYVRNPLQGAAEAAGMIAPIAATGGVAGAAGLGARGALAANTLLGGAMGAGQVRGNLFEKIAAMPDGDLMAQSPQYAQLRQAGMSEADAKQQLGTAFMSNLPEIAGAGALNAVGARFGPVERALAGAPASVGRAAATALEAGWQAGQAGGTQLASNVAARGALPNQSLSEGVGTAAATGALMGGVTGAALGGSHGARPDGAPVDASADAAASAQDAAAPVLALPAPTYRLGGPDAPATPQGFSIEGSAYNAVPDDVAAALGTLPKVYNRQWATDYLTSALRNGTLEDAARQQNSIGRAAQALLARVQERAKPRQLDAPETPAALPSPDMPDASGDTLVDAAGGARQPTYQESADARAARQSALDTGLSPDVRAAQEVRARGADAPLADTSSPSTDVGSGDASSAPAATDTAVSSPSDARPVVLQNRDRASAGAIGQMNAIAAAPDPGRLSFSRDFANGAPVVEANSGVDIPPDQLGRQDFSVAADGRRIPIQYAVVDADTLLPSNSADGVPNAGYAQGEPNRMRAIAGNGRVAALQAAYERGTAGGYRSGIGADAALTGISPDVVAKMHNPVLVRVMPREAVTPDIGDVSNTAGTAALSPVEQASTDAQRVNLDALEFTDAGEPTPDSVRAFVQSMPVGERVGLLNPDGSPTRQAIDRMMSATFQRAYGDPELVRLYAQATDPEARTVLGGMASAAGAMARLDGAGDLDVRPLVTDAARLAVNARRAGVKLQDFARQGDIAMTPEAREFVRLFADNARSGKRIGEALQRVADFAYNEVTKPTEDMFGKVERATRAQLLENVNDTARPQDMGVAVGREPAESGAVQQAADAGRRADGRSAEEVGTARSGEVARPGGESAESVAQTPAVQGVERGGESVLTSPTPAELRARDEQQRARAAADASAQRVADQRAQADEQAKDFRLTGSDRDADRAVANGQTPLFSRSAQKSVDANIKRGRASMNRALLERRDVNRAMHRSDLGWIDFVWGDDKKGIQHIIRQRMTKDGLTEDQATRMLVGPMVETIARGETVKRSEIQKNVRLDVRYDGHKVVLVRRDGGNGWIVTGFELHEGKAGTSSGEQRVGFDTAEPTQTAPTRTRRGLGADDGRSIPPPREADLSRKQAPPSEGLSVSGGEAVQESIPASMRDRIVESGAFKRWFGKSRAVDEGGKPLVFYRGTRNEGAEPYSDHAMIFLTRDPAFASNYARDGAVFPVYAKVERPFDASRGEGLKLWREFVQETNAPSYASARSERGALPLWTIEPELRRWLDAKGIDYDGIYFAENDGKSSLAVRSMQQIKSAIGNRGTFDPTSPDIAMSRTSRRRDGLDASAVRRAIADDTFSHNVDVYDTIDDAPAYVREQAQREGADDVEGFFDPRTNRVALIAENVASPDRARAVARHELIGHYGIENMVGRAAMRDLATKVSTAERLGNKAFREIGAEVDRTQPGLSADRRAREMIAMMAERNMHNSIVRRVLDGVRKFLNRIGVLRGDTTDAEIAGMLRDAQAYMREQGRPSIADPEAATAFAKARQSEPRSPVFSRAGAARGPVPMVGREPTVTERIREMWRNPEPTKDAARTLLSEGAAAPQPKWLEDATTALFDYRNPIEQVIRRTGNTEAGRDFRNTMRTFEAATQKTLHDFESSRVDPMLGALRDAWKNDFEKLPWYKEHGYRQFLQDVGTIGNLVKHGRERNAEIARKTEGKDLAGSGATNEEIAAFEQHFRQSTPGLIEFYEGLYRDHLKPMLDYRDQTLRDAGLLTPDMESGRPKYDWYLPLYGDPGEVDDGGSLPVGGGASLKSPKDKQAMGRSGTLADNPLQNVLVAADSAIRNAGMQQFKKDFVRFVKDAPGAKAMMSAKVNEAPNFEIFEKYVDKDGIVKQRVKPNATMSPDAIVLREGDKTTVVHVGNRKVMDALKGANRAQIDGLLGLPMKATRVLSRVYTSWNPMFPLMNKLRDVQSMASLVMADAPTADKLGAVRRMLANNATFMSQWRVKPGSEYHHWLERFEELGGATQYTDLFNDDIMKNIENEFGKLAGVNAQYKAKAAAQKVGDFVDRVNEHMEMTSRVSLFKALVESGVPERDAVLYAKNTMNFETKGKLGQQLGALYTFAGPALFDARRMSQALRTPRGAAMMLAQFALMYGMYGALKAMGGQDDDGVDRLNKVPLSQSGRFLTMIDPSDPDGRGFKFPVGFGFQRIALTLAASLHRYADGIDDTGTFLSNVLKDGLLSNFSPVEPTDIDPSKDLSQWAMQQFAPSVAKPLLQLALNQTGQGNPIHKPDEWTGNKLHFQQAWPQTSGLFRGLAKQLYDNTGIDVYPETLQFLMRSYGGGGALDAIKAIDAMGEKADVDKYLTDMPMVRSFGSGPVPQDMTVFRQNSTDIDRLVNERKYAEQEGKLDEFDAANPGVEQRAALMKAANGEIKALYKERQEALADEDPAQRQQRALEVNRRIRAVQMHTNRAYKEVMTNAG
ncbi:LPD38 domain-containing protein [Burkholderia metallica]|uniref:LPD38 domain-containing protein n=1 Tax=Burkholderia metallica TaxID=488729 RepID=UPI001CF4FCAE|nr:LPD38 domain-containing protein [Burkholderia metallica]MCA8017724.1 hypothetical protein [Burkholderia metallica]